MAKPKLKLNLKTKVPAPKTKSSARNFPQVRPPRLKPLKSRIYTKSILRGDPSEFTNFGFGETGLSGRS